MMACNCKGLPEKSVKDRLAEAAGPVNHEELHREMGGDNDRCCGCCRDPEGDRLFVNLVNTHNAKFPQSTPG